MTNRERLESELEIVKLQEEYEALRPKVEDKANQKPEDMARYRELNDQIAAARTAFKQAYPPATTVGGDAVAEPATIAASTRGEDG
jgi:predicted RNA-binding protein